jgi:C-terminal processing protease CtpA/Prc
MKRLRRQWPAVNCRMQCVWRKCTKGIKDNSNILRSKAVYEAGRNSMKTRIVFATIAGLLLACSTYAQESTNSIVGIGLMLRASDQTIIIQQIVPNSPAAVAGLAQGEIVERIDGTSTTGMDIKRCVNLIRGPVATTVTLEVVDPKDNTTHVVTLTRQTIAIPPAPHTPAHGP